MEYRILWVFLLLFIHDLHLNGQIDSVLSKVEVEMDFRFRAEQDWDSQKSDATFREDRSRLRYRFRTGATYKSKGISFGFRIRTGDPNKQQDPQLTLGKGWKEFGTLPIGFEKVFFQSKWEKYNVWMGKNTYPFEKNNELFWSDNVFPEGVSLDREFSTPLIGLDKVILKGGHFIIASNNQSFKDDAYFQGFQALLLGNNKRFKLFPSIYLFRNIPNLPDGAHTYFLNYTLIHLGASLKPIEDKPLRIDIDIYQNIENYDPLATVQDELRDQKVGYVLGLQYGNLRTKKDWMVKFTYANLERYSILDYMAQNDWARWDYSSTNSPDGRLSNLQGVEIVGGYALNDKTNLIVKYYWVEQLIPYGVAKETGQRIRFDINTKI